MTSSTAMPPIPVRVVQAREVARPFDDDGLAAARRDLEATGFAVVGPVIDEETLARIEAELGRYEHDFLPRLGETIIEKVSKRAEDGRTNRRLYNLHQTSVYFSELAERPPFRELADAILRVPSVVYAVETWRKLPNVGRGALLHQEAAFYEGKPEFLHQLTVWIALDSSTVQNGCVRYWSGSHRSGLLPHDFDAGGHLVCSEAAAAEVTTEHVLVEVPRGWVALHTGLTAHDSLPNNSDAERMALIIGYRAMTLDECAGAESGERTV